MKKVNSYDALDPSIQELLTQARKQLSLAYAPYSHFHVGSALRTSKGKLAFGANQENASFPLSMCGERVALYNKAMQFPDQAIESIAIVVKHMNKMINEPGTPCGACRQVLLEFEHRQDGPIKIILQGEEGPVYIFDSVSELLPFPFDRKFL